MTYDDPYFTRLPSIRESIFSNVHNLSSASCIISWLCFRSCSLMLIIHCKCSVPLIGVIYSVILVYASFTSWSTYFVLQFLFTILDKIMIMHWSVPCKRNLYQSVWLILNEVLTMIFISHSYLQMASCWDWQWFGQLERGKWTRDVTDIPFKYLYGVYLHISY